ncbi:transcriptional regulator [Sphingomonas sp. Leaf357]|uniref:MucR family transcriptional regulator n=1 Tax=Sphingomonas sp. Leaf357 TaxID=1736350 RepID=UPI0006F77072|nr:MucR family transcriptional regulator [Sphingomonas sp. Leaf357]KQS05176.1 transcriptional regulator [Sphingomonas sp. Leaf357]
MADNEDKIDVVELATGLTVAWLSNSNTRAGADEVLAFMRSMHEAVSSLSLGNAPTEEPAEEHSYEPAVTARKSLSNPDFIISMIDGKPYKALRRHLTTNGLTPEQYRERYNLKADYPMVAPTYSEARRAMAHKIGLGSKGRQTKVAQAAKAPRKARAAKTAQGDTSD